MTNIWSNPWGTTAGVSGSPLDIQRGDLWSLDLSQVVRLVLTPEGVVPGTEFQVWQATCSTAPRHFTSKITLPERAINAMRLIQGTQGRHMPGYDEPLSVTRVEFIHEAPGDGNSLGRPSAIYGLLAGWFALAQAGQQKFDRVPLLLASGSSKPVFMADLTLTFLKGVSSGDPEAQSEPFDQAATYMLQDCWLSDLQLPDLDMLHAQTATITATLQIGAIVPIAAR